VELQRVCVYCGSNRGVRPAYEEAAVALGRALVDEGIGLVYGGGGVGLMAVIATAVLDAGGEVTGVIPDALMAREVGHPDVRDLRVVVSMHERKALMAELADGFVALPGGMGTFEELFEILTWSQLGMHAKPVVLLDVAGYWEPVFAMLDRAVDEGFVRDEHRALALRADDPREALELMRSFVPTAQAKWLDLDRS
jgi:uncharacterized protein (TIGR00730 family)